MNFPDWAPKALCDHYYATLIHSCLGLSIKEILERLTNGKGNSLCPNFSGLSGLNKRELEDEVILRFVECPLENDPWSCPNRQKELLERLLLDEYKQKIMLPVWNEYRKVYPQDPDLQITRDKLFPWVLKLYSSSLKEHPTRSMREAKLKAMKDTVDAARLAIIDTKYDNRICVIDRPLRIDEKVKEIRIDVDDLSYTPISDLLDDVAHCAESELMDLEMFRRENIREVEYVPNPGAKYSQANRLIRAMSLVFRLHFGSARPRLLARLVRTVLQPHLEEDMDIHEGTVKTSLREWYKANPGLQESLTDPKSVKYHLHQMARA